MFRWKQVRPKPKVGVVQNKVEPLISLHAICGNDSADAMRVIGVVWKWEIQVLIDNGSSHDFLDFKLARKLGWKAGNEIFPTVQVAGGKSLNVHGICKGFS